MTSRPICDPKVSVLMPAYNREKYIAQAIESVLSQTFTDFELIVVDDCSRDRTVEIAQTYASDTRVRVYSNETNLGQFPNRNHAATYARGSFLKYHDSDDVMYPHCLEVMVKPLQAEPRAGFAVSYWKRWVGAPCPALSTPLLTFQREMLGAEGIFWASPGQTLFRTEVFRQLGGFPNCGAFSDTIFVMRACTQVSVLLLPADLFWYRSHPDQEPFDARDHAARCAAQWSVLKQSNCPLRGNELEQAKRNWCWRVARYACSAIFEGHLKSGIAIARSSGISASEWVRYLRRPRRSDAAGVPRDESEERGVSRGEPEKTLQLS